LRPDPLDPGDDDHAFEPTQAEIQALREMVDAEIRLNRENVMTYMRDNDNRHRLGQPEGIATKRAADLAKWGRDNGNGLKAVI
jgi:predicted AAA+ superfamily ATPase